MSKTAKLFHLTMWVFFLLLQAASAECGLGTWTGKPKRMEFHNYIKFAPKRRLGWRSVVTPTSCTHYFHFIVRSYRTALVRR